MREQLDTQQQPGWPILHRWASVLILSSVLLVLGWSGSATAQDPMCDADSTAVSEFAAPLDELVMDCATLLGLKGTLEGDRGVVLDWAENISMSEWDGITVDGTPPRVTGTAAREEQAG